MNRRERVAALRAKLNPISQEDGDNLEKVIIELREDSIPRDLSS